MYKEILLPVDLQETALSERAITIAQEIADAHRAHITVLTVVPDFGMPLVANFFPDDALEKVRKEACAELKRFIAARFRDPAAISSDVAQGSPHKVIVDYARQHGIDVIIMPSHAKDISRILLGSSAMHVVERANCSVLVVKP